MKLIVIHLADLILLISKLDRVRDRSASEWFHNLSSRFRCKINQVKSAQPRLMYLEYNSEYSKVRQMKMPGNASLTLQMSVDVDFIGICFTKELHNFGLRKGIAWPVSICMEKMIVDGEKLDFQLFHSI